MLCDTITTTTPAVAYIKKATTSTASFIRLYLDTFVCRFDRLFLSLRDPSSTAFKDQYIFNMDCFPDFCLGCDKTASDGFYCSESCRLSDIERSGSGPTSPADTISSSSSYNQFSFSPIYNQPPSRYPPPPTKSISSTSLGSRAYPTQHHHSHSESSSPHRVLSPSSSRSSLKSNGTTTDLVSEVAAKELLNYFNAFDRTRDQRRRSLPAKASQWTTLRTYPEGGL